MSSEALHPVDILKTANTKDLTNSLIVRVQHRLGMDAKLPDPFMEHAQEDITNALGHKIHARMSDDENMLLSQDFASIINDILKHAGERPHDVVTIGLWAGLQLYSLSAIRVRNISDLMYKSGRDLQF